MRAWWLVCGLLVFGGVVAAQDEPLTIGDIQVVTETDAFGQTVQFAEGAVTNSGDQPYSGLSLLATALDAGNEAVGEGFGYPVNACGTALLEDFILPAGASQRFSIPLELYETDSTVDHVEVTAEGTPSEATPETDVPLAEGISRVSSSEVVEVEWIDDQNLRFGVGCYRDLFNQLQWFDYKLGDSEPVASVHPKAELITEALLRQLGLLDPVYLAHSFLTYAPNARRMVYQTDVNSFLSAEPDGSFKRVIFEDLFNRTLQGINWLDKGRFLAYYYGAYGDPVLYFTASVEGQILSEPPQNTLASITIPGVNAEGTRIIVTTEVGGVTGYYVKQAINMNTRLLFEAEVPGNNWPAPIYEQDADGAQFLYIALPVDGEAHLACYNMQTETLHDLAPLPLQLTTDERAWWFLSPDHSKVALAANGIHEGLWMIDLNTVGSCE